MVFRILYGCLCVLQCFTLCAYINTYRKPGCKNMRYKAVCSAVFVAAGLSAGLSVGRFSLICAAVLLGLVMSFVGDMCLAVSCSGTPFVAGLSFFLLGHIAYIVAFCLAIDKLPGKYPLFGLSDAVIAVALLIAVFAVKFICKITFDGMGIPVFIYAVVICLMLTKAVLLGVRSCSDLVGGVLVPAVVPLAASLFVASDAVLVFILFKKKKGVRWEGANLTTYYGAQMLLAGSIMLLG